jgi:multiple sugar transport system substrate-binding protein
MAKKGQLRLWPRPPVAEYYAIVRILGAEVHDMLKREQAPSAMLTRAQSRIDALMREHGHY